MRSSVAGNEEDLLKWTIPAKPLAQKMWWCHYPNLHFPNKKEKQQKRNWNEFSISIAFCLSRNQLQGTINCFNILLFVFYTISRYWNVGWGGGWCRSLNVSSYSSSFICATKKTSHFINVSQSNFLPSSANLFARIINKSWIKGKENFQMECAEWKEQKEQQIEWSL